MSATVEIADPRGELFAYSLRRLPAGAAQARYELRKVEGGATHVITLWRGAVWECSCKAFEFRNARARKFHRAECKHVAHVRDIHNLLAALGPAPDAPSAVVPSVFTKQGDDL